MGFPLTLTYTYTRELHDRSVQEITRGRLVLRPWHVRSLLGLFFGWAAFAVLSVTKTPVPIRAAVAAAVALAAVLWFWKRITTRPPLPFDQAVAVRLTDEGLQSRIGESEHLRPWSELLRLNEDGEYLHIHWKNLLLTTLPKAAFASAEDVETLRVFLRTKATTAIPDPAPLRSILGRTRPVFYLLFLGAIALVMFVGPALHAPVIGEPEFLELKSKGLIHEVEVRTETLLVVLKQDVPRNGKRYRKFRLPRPKDGGDLDHLLRGLSIR